MLAKRVTYPFAIHDNTACQLRWIRLSNIFATRVDCTHSVTVLGLRQSPLVDMRYSCQVGRLHSRPASLMLLLIPQLLPSTAVRLRAQKKLHLYECY